MKRSFKISVRVILLIGLGLCFNFCQKKSTLSVVTTTNVTDITQTTATTGGDVTNDGGAEVTDRGVTWGSSHNPTISMNYTEDGSGTGSFTSYLTNLKANNTYYVRAYATNVQGTSYGEEISFVTGQVVLATLTTADVTSITQTTAISGIDITDDGGGTISALGICWSTSPNPTISDNKTAAGSGTGSLVSYITGLIANTTYYIRAYAINSAGTAYGNQQSFTTLSEISASIFNSNLKYGTVPDINIRTGKRCSGILPLCCI